MDMVVNALPSLKDALASHIFNDGDDIYGNVLLPDYMKSEPIVTTVWVLHSEILKFAIPLSRFLHSSSVPFVLME
jgi:hypothetical protein